MSFLTEWLQDWSDACAYANECWPDLPLQHEPYSALAGIFLGCFAFWAWNEWRGAKQRFARACRETRSSREFGGLVEHMRTEAATRKLAA